MDAPLGKRRAYMRTLSDRERLHLLQVTDMEMGTPFGIWQDDPLGFVYDVLGERTWSLPRKILTSIPHHQRIAVPSAFSTGKCVWEHDQMMLADGTLRAARDLVGTEFEVLGWDSATAAQTRRTARAEWNAVEPTYRLRTESGREIVRNAAHPLWTGRLRRAQQWRDDSGKRTTGTQVESGRWTSLAEIDVDRDVVLVPTRVSPVAAGRMPFEQAALLGYLLGDGHTGAEVRFSHLDGEALEEFIACVAALGGRVADYPSKGQHREVVVRGMGERRGQWLANPVVDLVRSWGLMGCKAVDKDWPEVVWTLHPDDLAVVVGRLFACDGWATVRPSGQATVAIGLSNEGLIRGLHRLMLRLGVPGTVRRRETAHADSWEWSCTGDAVTTFVERIAVPDKAVEFEAAAKAVAMRSQNRDWRTRCAPEGYRWERVKSITRLPGEHRTVAVEVDVDHAWVDLVVEHNTWSVSRSVLWHSAVYPVGTGRVVTIAAKWSQVTSIIWPEIRRAHKRAGLPGNCDVTQMKMSDRHGTLVVVAEGIAAAPHNETAVQGIHAPHLLLIVDEAGGISRTVGRNLRALLQNPDTSMVAIGNPPTDDEGSWFETLCAEDNVLTIPISALDTPNLTGERVDRCFTCPPEVPPHLLSKHLAGSTEVQETIDLNGLDSNYVQAKVLARFPKGGPSRTLPSQWLEDASDRTEDDAPLLEGQVRLSELGLPEEVSKADPSYDAKVDYMIEMGARVRLGVDIASDGGDEMVVARIIGDLLTVEHASSGSTNTDPVDVAGKILHEIHRAEAVAKAIASPWKVRVKIDVIGLGWGVVGLLAKWGEEGRHDSEIVGVDVAEGTYRPDDKATDNPANKRAEMWLAFRTLIQPSRGQVIRLRVDKKAVAQLGSPMRGSDSHGRTTIESKASMKRRGLTSPDRAEAILLAPYEPLLKPAKRKARLLI